MGGVSHSPKLYPAAYYAAGWSHPGVSGTLNRSVGGGPRPIAPAPPFSATHGWGTSFQASQGFGIASNANGPADFGWPQGYLPYLGGLGGGMMVSHVGGGPIGNAPGTPTSGALGSEVEDDEEDDEEDYVAPRIPAVIPPGRDLNATPWCCGSGKTVGKAGEPGLLCDTLRCKRWMCHVRRTDERRGNGCSTFVCCDCAMVVGTCWCCR